MKYSSPIAHGAGHRQRRCAPLERMPLWLLVALALVAVLACSPADLQAITESSGGSSGADTTGSGGAPPSGGASHGGGGAAPSGGTRSSGGAPNASGGSGGAACPATSLRPGDTVETLRIGGKTRSFVLHVPSTYDGSRRVPLVVDFHGMGSSGSSELANSAFTALTDPESVIWAFPDGLKGPLGTAWNLGPCCVADVDDL
ncbi:MAG TPA: hypothetical protein VFQ35_16860, partial [Polyangiaceae bacterium]|nr:hypothetical protein [Polyangiaceae bacterium]